jgi:hypothetical protein
MAKLSTIKTLAGRRFSRTTICTSTSTIDWGFLERTFGGSTPTGRASRHKILDSPLTSCNHPSTSSGVDGKFNQNLITTYLSFTSSGSSGLFSNYGRCSRKQACIQAWLSERREFPTPLCAEATGDAFANGLAIDAERAGDRRDRQSLSMKIKNHDDFPKLNHRSAPSFWAERDWGDRFAAPANSARAAPIAYSRQLRSGPLDETVRHRRGLR